MKKLLNGQNKIMKELSIKEKAKCYDKAIEKLHEIITMDNRPVNPKEIGEYLFPELKESEDERIKKMLIEQMKRWKRCAEENDVKQDIKDATAAIVWLEKQGEQKSLWSEEDEEMIKGLNNCLFELEEKNGWRYTYINNKDVELDKIRIWLKSIKERVQPQPKQEWNEEDKKLIDDTCHLINTMGLYQDLKKLREG